MPNQTPPRPRLPDNPPIAVLEQSLLTASGSERIAVMFKLLRFPSTFILMGLLVYATLGLPALRIRSWEKSAPARCFTITGEYREFAYQVPLIVFIRGDRTLPVYRR